MTEPKKKLTVKPLPTKVLGEWLTLLKGLEMKDEDAIALRDLIVRYEAFGIDTVVTVEDFVKHRWRNETDQRNKFLKTLDTLSGTRAALRDMGLDIAKAAGRIMQVSKKESETLETFCIQEVASREIRRFYNSARENLQKVLWENRVKDGYSLMVENIPGAWTSTGDRGYIVPGTVEALTRCIERASRSHTRYTAILANLRKVSKTVHGT